MPPQRNTLTLKNKTDVLKCYDSEKLSVRDLATHFKVGKSQISNILRNRQQLTALWNENRTSESKRNFSSKVPSSMARIEFNPFPLPLIQYEECWDSPLTLDGFEYDWKENVTPSERLHFHHTLTSIRHHTELKQRCAPKDSLDLVLSSVYDHTNDAFRDKYFAMTQPETVGLPTYRLLKNKRLIPAQRPARDLIIDEQMKSTRESDSLLPGTTWHGIRQGGITDKENVHHIKLGITGGHGSQMSRGYSRKNDGTFYSS